MARSTVLITERLRSWRHAGLHLLFPPGISMSACDVATSATQTACARAAAPSPAAPAAACIPDTAPNAATGTATGPAAVDATPSPPKATSAPPTTPPAKPSATAPVPHSAQASLAAPDAPWPNPWDTFWSKVKGPSATVWTYFELGQDLGGEPSAERRTMFQAIIRDLKWPGGSLAFWPMAALAHHTDESVASRLVPNSELFWRGVQQVQARTVLCFGARALAAIHPQSAASGVPFGQVDLAQPARATDPSTGVFSLYGTTLFALPEPHEILRSGPEGPAAVSSALRMLVRL